MTINLFSAINMWNTMVTEIEMLSTHNMWFYFYCHPLNLYLHSGAVISFHILPVAVSHETRWKEGLACHKVNMTMKRWQQKYSFVGFFWNILSLGLPVAWWHSTKRVKQYKLLTQHACQTRSCTGQENCWGHRYTTPSALLVLFPQIWFALLWNTGHNQVQCRSGQHWCIYPIKCAALQYPCQLYHQWRQDWKKKILNYYRKSWLLLKKYN